VATVLRTLGIGARGRIGGADLKAVAHLTLATHATSAKRKTGKGAPARKRARRR